MVKVSALEALFMMVKVGRRPETLPWDYACRSLAIKHHDFAAPLVHGARAANVPARRDARAAPRLAGQVRVLSS